MQPPEDMLGVPFPLTRVLVRERGLVMALEGGTAYSTGVELDLRCRIERAGASEDRWADIMDGFMGGRPTTPGSRRAREALHWSVSIPGREQVHAGDLHMFMQRSGERSQEEYRLVGVGGRGAAARMTGGSTRACG